MTVVVAGTWPSRTFWRRSKSSISSRAEASAAMIAFLPSMHPNRSSGLFFLLIAAAAPGAPAHRYRSVLTSGDLSDSPCYLLVVPRSVMMEEWGPAGPRHDRLPSVVDARRRCCHRGSLRRSRIADRGGILFEDRRNVGAERAPIRPASMLGQQRMRRGLGPVRAATAGGVRRCGRR